MINVYPHYCDVSPFYDAFGCAYRNYVDGFCSFRIETFSLFISPLSTGYVPSFQTTWRLNLCSVFCKWELDKGGKLPTNPDPFPLPPYRKV